MGRPERRAAQWQAPLLRVAVARSLARANAALRVVSLASGSHAPAAAPFRYAWPDAPGGTGAGQGIPVRQFERQYDWCLESLGVTVYGYCIERQFGWERKTEPALLLRRPAWWRRLLRPAPLLALTVEASEADLAISLAAAQRPGYHARINCIVRLEPALQQQLKQLHESQLIALSFKNKILGYLSSMRRRVIF